MLLVQDDHVIQQLPAGAADPSFGDSVLPWTPKGRSPRLDSKILDRLGDPNQPEIPCSWAETSLFLNSGKRAAWDPEKGPDWRIWPSRKPVSGEFPVFSL